MAVQEEAADGAVLVAQEIRHQLLLRKEIMVVAVLALVALAHLVVAVAHQLLVVLEAPQQMALAVTELHLQLLALL